MQRGLTDLVTYQSKSVALFSDKIGPLQLSEVLFSPSVFTRWKIRTLCLVDALFIVIFQLIHPLSRHFEKRGIISMQIKTTDRL